MPLSTRVADTRELLAGITIAAELSDGVVASVNSNLGRIILTAAGRDKIRRGRARSVDVFWYPTFWAPVWPECDGMTGGCLQH